MFSKNKIVRFIIGIVFSLICLYTGISCIATFHKANTQPYMVIDTVRFDFLGYYILATIYGAVCIVSIVAFAVYLVRTKKSNDKYKKI